MKLLFSFLCFLFFSSTLLSQGLNQFDRQGRRHGEWSKPFDSTEVIRYSGNFIHGKEVGVFKYYKNIKDKAVLAATKAFNKNDNITSVKFYDPEGKMVSEGKMDGKIYIGTWKYYHKGTDKLLIVEHFNSSGHLEGERLVYYKNNVIAERQHYKNGKLQGIAELYSEDKIVLKHFVYDNDELHGESKYYNSDGELIVKGRYKRDRKDGVWTYYEDGKIKEKKTFPLKSKKTKSDK